MNGLEQILQKIEDDNQSAVSQIISEAENNAKLNIENETAKAEAEAEDIISKAQRHAEQTAENAVGSCEAVIRKGELQAKSEIVADWIGRAMQKIDEMDSEEYFSTMFNLILSHSSDKKGTLILNKKDKERMPSGYMKMLNDALDGQAELELSEEDADIKDGCIIRYGGIDENCTFGALLEEKSDEIKDKLFALINS
jgi:V/A-type H+-transporting ATPase subunit E